MSDAKYDEMEIADGLCESFVSYVKRNYSKFSPIGKAISEGQWEEWIRNHIEAKIFISGGTTLQGKNR